MVDLAIAGVPPSEMRYYHPNGRFIGEKGGRFDVNKAGSAHHYIHKSGRYLKVALQRWSRKNGPTAAKARGVDKALQHLDQSTLTNEEVAHVSNVAKDVLGKDLEKLSLMPPEERKKYDDTYNKELKTAVRVHYNYTCPICGKHETELDETLNVHHVHGDAKGAFEDVDNPNEFVPLCDKCHKKVHADGIEKSEPELLKIINDKMGGKSFVSPQDALPFMIHPPH